MSLLAVPFSTLHSLGAGSLTFPEWYDQWNLTAVPLTTAVKLIAELLASHSSAVGQKGQAEHVENLTSCT